MTSLIKLMRRIKARYHISNGGQRAGICLTPFADRH